MNCLFTLCFDGCAYHGFQIQQNALTVQQVFQLALKTVLRVLPDIKACSRTDSGVHAECFCVSAHIEDGRDLSRLQYSLNAVLPPDVRVLSIRAVAENFHARYSALSKRYEYRICNAAVLSPFLYGRTLHLPAPHIDELAVCETAQRFVGRHDFTAFCGIKGRKEDMNRTVYSFTVERAGDNVVFSVSADGFLYNMVRIMAGTLISAARGSLDAKDISAMLISGCRRKECFTAPAHGLFLCEVNYGFGD